MSIPSVYLDRASSPRVSPTVTPNDDHLITERPSPLPGPRERLDLGAEGVELVQEGRRHHPRRVLGLKQDGRGRPADGITERECQELSARLSDHQDEERVSGFVSW
jgi:hypothetical protein